MKEIVFVSGKGGTGKTSLTASIATIASRSSKIICADCDVDAADLHLIFQPIIRGRHDFTSGHVAKIDQMKCISSGICDVCMDLCRFDAISYSERNGCQVNEAACEGCGVCVRFCPAKAIDFPERHCGEWYLSETRFGPLVHASLDPGGENSGKLVTAVRREAKRVAEESSQTESPSSAIEYIIVDGSPGTGCPVIASITGADAVVAVTEPTRSGLHDLERLASLARHFEVPVLVCINRADINTEISASIEAWCGRNGISCIGTIPYNPVFTAAQIAGKSVVEYIENSSEQKVGTAEVAENLHHIWERICQLKQ